MVEYEWVLSSSAVDWCELSRLHRLAGLSDKTPTDLKTSFANSRYVCFVYDDGRLIGVGRALADGIDCSYICDLAIHPDYQRAGLGTAILSRLVEMSRGHRKIILYAAPGKEDFYRTLGFKRMKTAMALFRDQRGALARGLLDE
ncbi:MAG: GNAT family N-acetyltransferase [Coriobacteriia bacterium]|nr:GNAT family N-acetyltransferase [Coriobacteriia bacterium]